MADVAKASPTQHLHQALGVQTQSKPRQRGTARDQGSRCSLRVSPANQHRASSPVAPWHSHLVAHSLGNGRPGNSTFSKQVLIQPGSKLCSLSLSATFTLVIKTHYVLHHFLLKSSCARAEVPTLNLLYKQHLLHYRYMQIIVKKKFL